ncbi:hypothetical protein NUW58_g697 [Xylaria curta]|uniref:Uncharacterized protein n=1 Tax=Xylaria curta TaxID=42375 RepID=A0ACC1PQU7_9PEZI|nr:hypothetical protein NUW58_g697 [Xylaria curta]
MPVTHSIPQFGQLPVELRNIIWRFACQSGPMRLTLVKEYHGYHAVVECFILPPKWHEHVSKHQNHRMAILHVNSEARSEALRRLDLISTHQFPFFMNHSEHKRFHHGGEAQRPQPRFLAVDWQEDLMHIPWYPDLDVKHAAPFDKVTRLAINAGRDVGYVMAEKISKRTWVRKLLETFTVLEHLTIVFDGNFYDAPSEMRDYDYISCVKDIPKDKYYFSPSPKKTVDDWLLCVLSKGSMDPRALDDCGMEPWPYHSGESTTDDVDLIRKIGKSLRPSLKVQDVVDTTMLFLW